jgi:hypothetical protein
MGNPSPNEPVVQALFRRFRHSAATSVAAMMLFVVLATMWLVAAATAQVWYHSAPSGYQFASISAFYRWIDLGVAGVVLMFGSLVHRLWRFKPRPALAVLALCIGAAGELLIVLLVTRHAIETAPYGVDSGEGAAAIATLGLAQVVLVGLLRLFLGRFAQVGPEQPRGSHGRFRWSGLLCIVGMVITCGAFAAWSLCDGTTLIVRTSLIAGEPRMTNVGAWWPGLFAAMVTLMVITAICTPGIFSRTKRDAGPIVPSSGLDRLLQP